MTLHLLAVVLGHSVTFLKMFTSVFLANIATPLPSSAVMLSLGYLGSVYRAPFPLTLAAGIAGTVAADTATYLFIRRSRKSVELLERLVKRRLLDRFRSEMRERPARTILVLRFLPVPNVIAPVLAGSVHVPTKRYLAYEIAVVSLFALILTSVGDVFQDAIDLVAARLGGGVHAVAVAVIVIGGLVLYREAWRRYLHPFTRNMFTSVRAMLGASADEGGHEGQRREE